MVHGDAAIAGQGVVVEMLQMSQLRAYRTGGTIHVVVNNQVGFTTPPGEAHTSTYSTDVAKTIQAPIFHVNGDDPEAVMRVAGLAFAYRQEFHRDVVIDLVCYRRRGHNEGDDPSMTQPLMYNLIEAKRSVRTLYTEALVGRGDITQEEYEAAHLDFQDRLERAFAETHAAQTGSMPIVVQDGKPVADLERPESQQDDAVGEPATTGVDEAVVRIIGDAHSNAPAGFTVHNKLQAVLQKRVEMSRNGSVDWGFGEMLALGSLLLEGTPVRMVGQDTRRGTFVQRHAVLHDRENGQEWLPLANLAENQARFWIYDSLLSEYAALAFEYGYSVERADALVLWEAQFGDFANGAQTVLDEFISSAEQKWGQRSSVVMLLPHGYEGQGPDHSSARIERYLQLCAENNMTVARPVDPGVVLPPAAPSGVRASTSAAHRLHPEGDAATARRDERGARLHAGPVRAGDRRPHPEQGCRQARDPDLRQDLLRHHRRGREARQRRRHRGGAARAVLPAADPGGQRGARAVPERRPGLDAGRAGEPGRLAVHLPRTREAPQGPHDPGRVAQVIRVAGDRLDEAQRAGADRPHRPGAHPGLTAADPAARGACAWRPLVPSAVGLYFCVRSRASSSGPGGRGSGRRR